MRDGIEHSERRERQRNRRWQVHGRSLQHVLNAIRRRAGRDDQPPEDARDHPPEPPPKRRR